MSQSYKQIIAQLEEQQKRDLDFRLGTLYAYAFGMVGAVVEDKEYTHTDLIEIQMISKAADEMARKYYPDNKEEDNGQI